MSERSLTTAYKNALDDTDLALAMFGFLDWPGLPVRFWSGVGQFSWDSQTWDGVGLFGSIDKIAESLQKTDNGIELKLNYLDDTTRNYLNANDPVGTSASLWLNLVNPATRAVTEVKEAFSGFTDRVEIEDAGANGVILVRLASEISRMRRTVFFALSHAHQQHLFPGDMGMEFASRMDQPLTWGRYPLPVYVPGQPSVPPATEPYPGYNDQYLFPLPGQQP